MSKPSAAPDALNLVNSSRLQALAAKTNALASDTNQQKANPRTASEYSAESHLQMLVEQRLTEILAGFPASKQRSLFKIRFGISVEELQQMPANRAAALLKIKPTNIKPSRNFNSK